MEYNLVILFIALFFSIISGLYYIRIVRFIFFTTINESTNLIVVSSVSPFVLLCLLNLFFIFFFDVTSEYLFSLVVELLYV